MELLPDALARGEKNGTRSQVVGLNNDRFQARMMDFTLKMMDFMLTITDLMLQMMEISCSKQ